MKNNSGEHLHIWKSHLKTNYGAYLLGVLSVLMTGILQVFSTRLTGWIVDFFQSPTSFEASTASLTKILTPYKNTQDNFLYLFTLLILSRVLLGIGRYGWRRTLARQSHKASAYLKRSIWKHAKWFPSLDLQTRFTKGVLMNASTSDINMSKFIFGFTIIGFLDVLFLGTISLLAMMSISKMLSFYALSVLILIPFMVRKLSELEIERYRFSQERLSSFNDLVTQCVSSIRLQRQTQSGNFWTKKLLHEADDYRKIRLEAIFTSLRYFPVMGGVSLLAYVILFFVGMNFVFSNKISVGDFVAMQGLILLIQEPLLELGYIISDWKKSNTSLERLHQIYIHPKDKGLTNVPNSIGSSAMSKNLSAAQKKKVFEIRSMSFAYPEIHKSEASKFLSNNNSKRDEKSESLLFENLSLVINESDKIGITGPIGAGKSTLIEIMTGLQRSFKGEVLFKGKRFDEFHHTQLRDEIAVVSQRPFLFASNIRENILLGKEMDDDKIWFYLKLAGLDEDVEAFSKGLDTPLGEWGINLSGGQKQRLTLARALSKESSVIILDDCLSAVDTVTEEKILDNLEDHFKDQTIIWIAHRKSTLKKCERIIDLEYFAKGANDVSQLPEKDQGSSQKYSDKKVITSKGLV